MQVIKTKLIIIIQLIKTCHSFLTCLSNSFSSAWGDQYLEDDTKLELEEFICDLYREVENSMNNARYNVFRKLLIAPEILTTTQDALYLHLKRAIKVAYEWKTALDQH